MKVTRILGTSVLLLGVATAAFAQPAVRLSWDNCDPYVQNQQYVGPINYNLVMSAINVSDPNNGHRTKVSIGPIAEAWRFDGLGCQTGQYGVSHGAVAKACPAMQGQNPLGLDNYGYDQGTNKVLFDVANAYDRFDVDPAQRYTLYKATFNHAFSTGGDGDPALFCRFADDPACFHIVGTELLLLDGTSIPMVLENDFVTWQDPNNDGGCPGATQTRDASWGRVKGLYR